MKIETRIPASSHHAHELNPYPVLPGKISPKHGLELLHSCLAAVDPGSFHQLFMIRYNDAPPCDLLKIGQRYAPHRPAIICTIDNALGGEHYQEIMTICEYKNIRLFEPDGCVTTPRNDRLAEPNSIFIPCESKLLWQELLWRC